MWLSAFICAPLVNLLCINVLHVAPWLVTNFRVTDSSSPVHELVIASATKASLPLKINRPKVRIAHAVRRFDGSEQAAQ